jgi:hypothetical protein
MNSPFQHGLGARSEEILRDLQHRIARGVVPPGARLKSERDLCAELGCNRATLRRAVSRLAADGWISVRHGSGMVVRGAPGGAHTPTRVIAVMFSLVPSTLARAQELTLASGFAICPFPRQELSWDLAAERRFLEQVRRDRYWGVLAFCTPTPPRNNAMLAATRFAQAGYRHARVAHLTREWPGAQILVRSFLRTPAPARGAAPRELLFPSSTRDNRAHPAAALRLIRDLPPATGILCTNALMGNDMIRLVREAGRAVPGDLGLLSVPCIDCETPSEGVDTLEFDPPAYLLDALRRIMAADWPVLRERVAPRIVARGSLKPLP